MNENQLQLANPDIDFKGALSPPVQKASKQQMQGIERLKKIDNKELTAEQICDFLQKYLLNQKEPEEQIVNLVSTILNEAQNDEFTGDLLKLLEKIKEYLGVARHEPSWNLFDFLQGLEKEFEKLEKTLHYLWPVLEKESVKDKP